MNGEGVIKFKLVWKQEPPMAYHYLYALNEWRNSLYKLGLIGQDGNGIGYGNISCRLAENIFIITGSGTGSLKKLTAEHYTKVTAYDLAENTLESTGPVKASSESMTHAAVYETVPGCNAVFHVHHLALWETLLALLPSTAKDIGYGTPAMAKEIARLLKDPVVLKQGILAMGGHKEGIISFGKDLDEAGSVLARRVAVNKKLH
jgi:L-ribulose-5-phosphate 4-epimerase